MSVWLCLFSVGRGVSEITADQSCTRFAIHADKRSKRCWLIRKALKGLSDENLKCGERVRALSILDKIASVVVQLILLATRLPSRTSRRMSSVASELSELALITVP